MNTKVIIFCVTVICLQIGVTSKKKSTTSILTKIISNTGDQVVENISTSNDEEDADSELKDTPQKRNIEYNLNSYPGGLDLQEYLRSLNYANDHPLKYLLIHDQGKAIPYTSDYTFGNYLKVDEQNQNPNDQIDRTTHNSNSNDYFDYGSLDTSDYTMSEESDPKVEQFLNRLKEVKILEVSTPVPEPETDYDDYEDSTEDTKLQLIAYIPSKAKFEETDDKLKRNKQTLKNMKKIILPIGTDKTSINRDNSKNTKLHIVAYVPTKKTKTNNNDDAESYNLHQNPTFENLASNFDLDEKQKKRVQFFINVPKDVEVASKEQSNTSGDTKLENNPIKNALKDGTKLRIVAYVPKKHKLNPMPNSQILSTVLPTHLYAVKQETSEEILNPLHKGINSLGQNIKIVTFVPKKALFRQPSYDVTKQNKPKQTYLVHQDLGEDTTTPGNVLSKLISEGIIKYQPLSSVPGKHTSEENLKNQGPVPFNNDFGDYQIELAPKQLRNGIKLHILQPNFLFQNNTKSYSVQEPSEADKGGSSVGFLNKPFSHKILPEAITTHIPNLINSGPVPFGSDENSLNPNSSWQQKSIAYLSKSIVTEPSEHNQNLHNKGPIPFVNGDSDNNDNSADQKYQIQTTTYSPTKFLYEPAIYQIAKNTDGNLQNTGPIPFIDGDDKNYPTTTKIVNTDFVDSSNKNQHTIEENKSDLHSFLQKLREENAARIQEYMKLKTQLYDTIRDNFKLKDTNFDSITQDSIADSSAGQSTTVEHRVRPDFAGLKRFKVQPLNTKVYYKNFHHQKVKEDTTETPFEQLLFNANSYQAQALTQKDTQKQNLKTQAVSFQNQGNRYDFGRSKDIFDEENAMIRFLTGGRVPPINTVKIHQNHVLNTPEPISANSVESEASEDSEEITAKSAEYKKQQEQAELREFLEKLREENARKVNEYIRQKETYQANQIITTQRTYDESENPLIYNENGILYDKFKNQITPETTSYHYLNNGKIPFFNHYAFGDLRKLKNTTIKTSVLENQNQKGEVNKNFESVAGMMKILAKEIAQLLQKQKRDQNEDAKISDVHDKPLKTTEKPPVVQESKLHEFLKTLREENEIKVKKFVKQQLTSAKEKDQLEIDSLEDIHKELLEASEDKSERKSPFRYLNYRQFEEMEKLRKQHESMFQDFFRKLRKDNEAKIDEFINGYMSHRNKPDQNETKEEPKLNQTHTDVFDNKSNGTNNGTLSIDEIKQKVVFLVIPNFQLYQPNNNTLQNASLSGNLNHTYFGNYSQISTNSHSAVKYTDISPFVDGNSSDTQQKQHSVTKFSFNYPKKNTSYLGEVLAENHTNSDSEANLSVDAHSIYSDSFGEDEATTPKLFASDENPDEIIEEDYPDGANIIDADRERELENEKKKKLVCVKNCAIINGGYYTYKANQGVPNQGVPPNLPIPQNIPTIQLPPPNIPNIPNIPNLPNIPNIPNIPLPHIPRLPHSNIPIGQPPINPHLINGFYPILPPRFPPNQIKHSYPPFPYTVNRPYPNNHNMFDHKWHHVNEDPDTDESFIHKLLYKYLK